MLVGLFCLTSIALAGPKKTIKFEKLPYVAKTLIAEHFNEYEVLVVKQEKHGFSYSYDVLFADGTKLEFDRQGELVGVESEKAGVPYQLIPRKIRNYVSRKFPNDVFVLEYERDKKGYEIKLSNDLEIKFDKQFQVYEIDD